MMNSYDKSDGWLGLSEMQIDQVDLQYIGTLGPGVVCLCVEIGSPAESAGLKTGDYLRSINGKSWDDYNDTWPKVGDRALLDIHRRAEAPSIDFMTIELLHEAQPNRGRVRRRKLQAALCGAAVAHNERFIWFEQVLLHPGISHLATRLAAFIAFKYLSRKTGCAFPRQLTLARNCSCSTSSIQRAAAQLYHHGFLRIYSGSKTGGSNRYKLSFPVVPKGNMIPKLYKSTGHK